MLMITGCSKWPTLTLARLLEMESTAEGMKEAVLLYGKLASSDQQRAAYYGYRRSVLESVIDE